MRPLRIAITTGDSDGVGTEVAAQALRALGPSRGVVFYLFRSSTCPTQHLKWIDRSFKRRTVHDWPEALRLGIESGRTLVDIDSSLSPPRWVEVAGQAALFGHLDALVTGPLSKTLIDQQGMNALGHTEILKNTVHVKHVHMGFLGKFFNVLLATGHMPLAHVSRALTESVFESSLENALAFRELMPKHLSRLPIAVLGLNPHAGEGGLIGSEEIERIAGAIEKRNVGTKLFVGPLPPDTAFLKDNWGKFSLFLSLYHDQGLIPFKAFHGRRGGVQVSMGLPFIRTSVDHGTAKDLFKKGVADSSSMKSAIQTAVALARKRIRREVR